MFTVRIVERATADDDAVNAGAEGCGELGDLERNGQQGGQGTSPQTLQEAQVQRAVGVAGHLASVATGLPHQGPGTQGRPRHQDGALEQLAWRQNRVEVRKRPSYKLNPANITKNSLNLGRMKNDFKS